MRKLRYIKVSAALGTFVFASATAHAQTEGPDVVAQSPNVLLLVDTSGSMEWKSSGDVDPICDPTNPNTSTTTTNEKSRWIELVETLTGTIDNYSCYAQKRDSTSGFQTEFQLSPTDPPYDLGYSDAYHRPMSSQSGSPPCAPGPGVLPAITQPYDFPVDAIAYRPFLGNTISLNGYQGGATSLPSGSCGFSQERDGLLDAFDGLLRFGLMTFDTHPDPGTGVTSIPSGSALYTNGMRGSWSYYLSTPSRCKRIGGTAECKSGTIDDPSGCCVGTPWNCNVPAAFEVGARNVDAPPWEGRMVGFGPSTEDGTRRNEWIQEILLATRPYGATPIAGMLDDARNFIWYDDNADPVNNGQFLGPSKDPLVTATCRPNYIILLTDGVPNTDLRPSCETAGSSAMCPYDKPEDIANDMVTSTTNPQVRTFVVGFALSTVNPSASGGTPVDCGTMDLSLCTPTPADAALQACCTLNNIAYNGTPVGLRGKPPAEVGLPPDDHAMFPKNPTELRTSLSRVFQTLLKQVTGRTSPVSTAAASSDRSGASGYEFTSGAKVLPTGLWTGVLNRQRLTCDSSLNSVVQDVDISKGDDFIANVNTNPTASDRIVFSVQPDQVTNTQNREATWTMRPWLESGIDDALGHYKGTQTAFESPSNFGNDIDPAAMKLTTTTCGTPATPVSTTTCRTQLLQWLVGLPSAKPVSRCPQTGAADCSVIGDIFHSLPQFRIGQPNEFIQDTAYQQFSADLFHRDSVLYTSSNDGFFHAFRVAPGDPTDTTHQVTSNKNNEEWSFIAPAVLPEVVSMYPGTTPTLNRIPALDGVPVVKDVAVTVAGNRALSTDYPYRFERRASPDSSTNEKFSYRTIVVQGYGAKRGAYFALDVTKPTIDPANATTTGPKFLWQLSTDDAGNQLFGKGSSTPLITNVFMDTKQTPEPTRLVAVAVLPGGVGDSPTSTTATCSAANDAASAIPVKDGNGAFRTSLRCYGANGSSKNSLAARSVTIVKLDTGEIIRTFRPAGVTQPIAFPSGASSRVTNYAFDTQGNQHDLDIAAPIVGQPVAYPAGTGLPADRIFVGDAEGRLWRIDVSSPDPAKWSMNLFFDPYDGATRPLGQPIQTPPVLSVDANGQITVNFSTGDQDNLTPDPNPASPVTFNYVASLTEAVSTSAGVTNFQAQLNWKQEFTGGKRVLGPMTLFNKTLYFSTFLQTVSATCNDIGTSSVWGLDYIQSSSPGVPLTLLPTIDYPNVVVSGVGLRQRPSCNTVGSSANATSTDAILGYGSVTNVTASKTGAFELVIQKGGAKASGVGSGSTSSASNNTVATDTVSLASPKSATRLESWAPIIE
ncbi:MAG TPA: hypothetical protein VHU80_11705 [Polyangiaceae bacterium]|jgi:type IV pilus assembly protein PilY1|nr:hypothetical protein [Polyangiaceae bacterium]